MPDQPTIEDLIEASSLGTPDAVAMRAQASDEDARRCVARARALDEAAAVERAAQAAWRTQFTDPYVAGVVWSTVTDEVRERWRIIARATLEAASDHSRVPE